MKFQILVVMVLTVILPIRTVPAVAQTMPHTISGQIRVIDPYYGRPREPCNQYRRGYQDITQGVSITIRDGRSNVIAVVDVPPGANEDTGAETGSVDSLVMCIVSIPEFQVPDSDFYVFSLGQRGEITKSRQQMQESDWQLELSIGGK